MVIFLIYSPLKKAMEIEILRDINRKNIRSTSKNGKTTIRIASPEHLMRVIADLINSGHTITGSNFRKAAARLYAEVFSL